MLNSPTKKDVWLVDNFVTEAGLGGVSLGERQSLDMSKFSIVSTLTQDEFDALMEEYFQEHGEYPDS